MMSKDIKALFFDIDGTLVPFGNHDIPAEVKECIRTARHKGIKVFISTGRHISWVDNIGDTEFDGYVTANGAVCLLEDKRTCIFRRCIDKSDIDRLIDYSSHSDVQFAVIPFEDEIFVTRQSEEVVKSRAMLKLPPIAVKPLDTARGKDIVQLMAFGTEQERNDIALFSKVLTDCVPTSWNPLFCDIVPKGSDKSAGIDAMISWFGIDLSSTVAFGDGDNDIGMLRHCGTGIAMGNAGPDVKAAADFITTDITDHGVANAFRHLGIIP